MNSWEKSAQILKSGGVVIIPSDSSFGIAALASNREAVERVYKIKAREPGKPSLLIVGSMEQARELVKFTPLTEELAQKYWPGGLTLVLDAKKKGLPEQTYGIEQGASGKHLRGEGYSLPTAKHLGGGQKLTLAVRLPDKLQLRELALDVGSFILPSANRAGLNTPFSASEVDEKLKNQVDFFLDEPTDGNPPSTLIDARGEKPVILRQGSVILDKNL